MAEYVVKIQRPLSDNTAPWLVYDQSRAVHRLVPRRQVPSAVVSDMGAAAKIYYWAVLEGPAQATLRFVRKADPQTW